jgi:hypothetical protein
MIETAAQAKSELMPSEFDQVIPIEDVDQWGVKSKRLAEYVDTQDEAEIAVDFQSIKDHVQQRQKIAYQERGIMFDAIDDPDPTPLGGFMKGLRQDQIQAHLAELIDTTNPSTVVRHLDAEYVAANIDELVATGASLEDILNKLDKPQRAAHKTELSNAAGGRLKLGFTALRHAVRTSIK